jgi:ABC-type lipopolysaccharide export system ATPase subunit
VGKYRIGEGDSAVLADFALEAKCYKMSNPVAVKELSRLISRLRHRQFGILVTTSYVATQAYKEIKEDEHPIIIISAVDILKTLKASGLAQHSHLSEWLKAFRSETY